jgi:queuine tRNA-ribosyltransferase
MFKLKHEDSKSGARHGVLKTTHGKLETPLFMPVATKGSVKYVSNEDLAQMGTQAFISPAAENRLL